MTMKEDATRNVMTMMTKKEEYTEESKIRSGGTTGPIGRYVTPCVRTTTIRERGVPIQIEYTF